MRNPLKQFLAGPTIAGFGMTLTHSYRSIGGQSALVARLSVESVEFDWEVWAPSTLLDPVRVTTLDLVNVLTRELGERGAAAIAGSYRPPGL